MRSSRLRRVLCALGCVLLTLPLLACVTLPWYLNKGTQATESIPRWACPTPTPKPFGEAGPVKGHHDGEPDPTSGVAEQVPEYYKEWEQEYGDLGDPAPAPTPYTKTGTEFYLDQLVNVSSDLDARASVQRTEVVTNGQRLYTATIDWNNRGEALPFSLARQVVISAVERADGARVSGDGWTWSRNAAEQAGLSTDDTVMEGEIPAGESQSVAPIFAPDGEVQTLALELDIPGIDGGLRVQWLRASDPLCAEAGTTNAAYSSGGERVQGAPPAASDNAIVAFAYAQIGRPYCWGGKGNTNCQGNPEVDYEDSCPANQSFPCWDCSGLTWGAYNSVGVPLGHGTGNQSQLPAVWRAGDSTDPASVAQPGDLMLFVHDTAGGRPVGRIDHVGLYAGDNIMIHAAYYPAGVIKTENVFKNPWYKGRLMVITRPKH